MAPATVFVHIGSPKTGTTYIQDVLWVNREALAGDGVLLPGHYRYARVQAARDLLAWEPDDGDLPSSWRRLAAEVTRWSGPSAVISQEFLCWASSDQIRAMVDSLAPTQVDIVLTVRDLVRLVPAQWQTAMRQRNTWTLDEYADAVAGQTQNKRAKMAARHFWRRQDYGPIVQRFADVVGLDHVQVVTLPPSGSDPDLLWQRFCNACHLDADTTVTGDVSHESLGAASTELMRRLNAHPTIEELPMRAYQKSVNGALSRRVLAHRRSREPGLVLPAAHQQWAEREAARVIADLGATGVRVIGDLDDLIPRPPRNPPVAPETLPPDELLEAALDGLAGLAAEHASLQRKLQRKERQSQTRREQVAAAGGGLGGLRAAWRRRRPRR
jgi:hypothetical protein